MAANTLSILSRASTTSAPGSSSGPPGSTSRRSTCGARRATPEFVAKDPPHLTPLLEEDGLPRGSLWESCAIMQYLCNKHGLDQFYPTDPAERAMTDSAMFYLIGTLYPLVARATYPTLGFPQYAGEVGTSEADDEMKAQAAQDAEAALAEPLEVYRSFFLDGKRFIGGDSPVDRRHPAGGDARVPERDRLRLPGLGEDYMAAVEDARRRLLGACGRRARLRRVGHRAPAGTVRPPRFRSGRRFQYERLLTCRARIRKSPIPPHEKGGERGNHTNWG